MDTIINARDANSLTILCSADDINVTNGGCYNADIYCDETYASEPANILYDNEKDNNTISLLVVCVRGEKKS